MAFQMAWGSTDKAQAKLFKIREADKAPGGPDHSLMVKQKGVALGNMCDMSEIKYAGCVAQF